MIVTYLSLSHSYSVLIITVWILYPIPFIFFPQLHLSLFLFPHPTECIEKTVKIDVSTVEIEERGVKVRLTVVDTPGYGDAIDNTDW